MLILFHIVTMCFDGLINIIAMFDMISSMTKFILCSRCIIAAEGTREEYSIGSTDETFYSGNKRETCYCSTEISILCLLQIGRYYSAVVLLSDNLFLIRFCISFRSPRWKDDPCCIETASLSSFCG